MTTSQEGKTLIQGFEGLRLRAYRDVGGLLTVGWGHTGGVYEGMQITEETAEQFFQEDLAGVDAFLNQTVTVPLTQHQFDALASFVFNEGTGRLMTSTLLKKLIGGDYEGAADEFLRWDKAHTPAGDIVEVPGLLKRRTLERQLFLTPD